VFEVPAITLHPAQPEPAVASAEAAPTRELSRAERRAARAERRAAWLEKRDARRAKREARRAAAEARSEPDALAEAPEQAPEEESAASEDLAAAMPKSDEGPGMLRINSRPWSKVFVDDHFVGNTPQLALELEAGRHSVRLVNEPLGMAKTFIVTIRSGEMVTKVENLID
jgi:PEGA domain